MHVKKKTTVKDKLMSEVNLNVLILTTYVTLYLHHSILMEGGKKLFASKTIGGYGSRINQVPISKAIF